MRECLEFYRNSKIRKRLKGRNLVGEPKHSAGNGQSKAQAKGRVQSWIYTALFVWESLCEGLSPLCYFNREGCWEKQHSQIPCRCWVAELEDSVEGVIPIDHLLDKANSKIRMQHLHCTQFYLKNCKYQYRHMIQQKVKHKFWEKKTPRQVQCMPWVHYPLALVKF
jgi:hypothetical protein